ncbi:MAG: DUF411 domain-containing protein [Marinobacter sp.]|uniref:DUF411 domain-containing protein n=1 Tax=Marinobacter sp. TaxID=50741 RepID=UPI00299DBABA|nr:DUF411 domain-containing protein [Marinobacter sp.]MDX1756951.1 DUF411 domain-containing protein [Marinobacter sp.]
MKKLILALGFASGLFLGTPGHAETAPTITVYKSPTCGCCRDWVRHLEENGFEVEAIDTQNLNTIKAQAGLTPALASCHTAFVNDYVIEGHVPARDIHRLLAQDLPARGLSVPGMPVGSPGMELGDRQDAYQVLLFNEQGQTRVFADYR